MTNLRNNQNKAPENHGTKKALIAAVWVVCALLVILITFLACKNSLYYSLAENKAEDNDFSAALEIAEKASGSKAELFCDYLMLRIDINTNYPMLLSNLNIEKINEWNSAAARLCERSGELGSKYAADITAVKQRLDIIIGCVNRYNELKPEIFSMMDIFAEINRLYTKDIQGKNTAFTVAEERVKLENWLMQLASLEDYAKTVPDSESIYLLNYLIKEVRGEYDDVTAAINSVIESGYTETDVVRFSGTGQKNFPGIQNDNNESVNVLEKERYEAFMQQGIERALAESLGEFYTP